jgi:hypothetical protein
MKTTLRILLLVLILPIYSHAQKLKPSIAFEGYVEVIIAQGYDTLLVFQGMPGDLFKPIIEQEEEFIVCYENSRHTLTIHPPKVKATKKPKIFVPKGDYAYIEGVNGEYRLMVQ